MMRRCRNVVCILVAVVLMSSVGTSHHGPSTQGAAGAAVVTPAQQILQWTKAVIVLTETRMLKLMGT